MSSSTRPPAEGVVGESSTGGRVAEVPGGDTTRSTRAAGLVIGLSAAAAIPLIVFVLGRYRWFKLDDWAFITERELGSADDLLSDYNGHWSTVPIVVFRAIWAVFGLRTYVPYQLVVVVLHVGVVVLLRVVMRRAGVGPWLATAAAGALVLFGPGRENIIWAFQIGLTGALFFGLAQLVLADHGGAVDRRDPAALTAGVLAVMSAGTAVPLVVATGVTLLVRRGWRRAALHTAPLAALYVVWSLIAEPNVGSAGGRPDLATVIGWVRNGYAAVLVGPGHHAPVVWALVILLVVGLALLVVDRADDRVERLRRAAGPLALLMAGLVFMLLTVHARWTLGVEEARAGRYVHVGAVLLIPALAVAANEVARRWREATPAMAALLVVAVPWNVGSFDDDPWGTTYHEHNRELLTSVPRLPEAHELPPETRPDPNRYLAEGLDLGFLLQAAADGKLEPSDGDLSSSLHNELIVRLHLQQKDVLAALSPTAATGSDQAPVRCRDLDAEQDLEPSPGTVYVWDGGLGGLRISAVGADGPIGPALTLRESHGSALVAQSSGRRFDWEPASAGARFDLCELRLVREPG